MIELPPERTGYAPPPALAERRQQMAEAVASGIWKTDPPPLQQVLGGVRVLRFLFRGAKRGTVLHFHGGAYRLGCPEMIAPYAAALAAKCQVEVVCPAYRLAPEHPFPAGIADGQKVLAALHAEPAVPVILSGDSAGGGLAVSLMVLALQSEPRPAGLVLQSPWLDLTLTSTCYEENAATDPLFSRASAADAVELYLQGMSPSHPLASALLAPLQEFPPSFISIGEGEVLAQDGRRLHTLLVQAGRQATFYPVAGMEHVAVTRSFALAGATETFESTASFIEALLGSDA